MERYETQFAPSGDDPTFGVALWKGCLAPIAVNQPYRTGSLKRTWCRTFAQLMLNSGMPAAHPPRDRLSVAVSAVTPPLLDAIQRLVELVERPQDLPALAPLAKQEICYRLFVGEQGPRLRRMVSVDSHGHQIARAIDRLKDNFDKPFRVEDLAGRAGLSTSSFNNHFRAMTAMSPLQFQKRMHLNEARRLMFTGHLDASSAAFEVGYECPSQFSREYGRLFGAPPARDIKNLSRISVR